MALVLSALKTELQTDPTGLGFAALITAGDHVGLAAALNLPRAGIQVNQDTITKEELQEAITAADLEALTQPALLRLIFIGQRDVISIKGTAARAILAGIFPAGSATRTALAALRQRQGSRAEQLFGAGVVINHEDIAAALK